MFKRAFGFLVAIILILIVNCAFAKMMESKKPRLPTKEQRVSRIQARINELNKKLNLNEEQKTKIKEILTETKEETVKMLEETGERIAEAKAKGEEEVGKVLTKEQRDKFNNVYEKEEDDEDVLKVFKTSY